MHIICKYHHYDSMLNHVACLALNGSISPFYTFAVLLTLKLFFLLGKIAINTKGFDFWGRDYVVGLSFLRVGKY